jgi:protein O-mannosyl-transferase
MSRKRHSPVPSKSPPQEPERLKPAPPGTQPTKPASRISGWWICLALAIATVAVYAQARRFDFVNYDDPQDVTNAHIRRGITPETLEWAFTSGEFGNWYPLTRLSHMLDSQLFGMRGGPHHLSNVLWHVLGSLLLFAFLSRATGTLWQSALVAFFFALHPLQVESVAWVTGRKDILCALFCFLGLWLYVRYAERPSRGRYLLVLLAFCFGMMAKPMIVSFPFVLLLLDYWPLGRLSGKVIREKIPFLVLSLIGAIAAFFAQRASGAVQPFSRTPLVLRVENALVSYAVYIGKLFWPARLTAFYPYPRGYSTLEVGAALLLLAGISAFALRKFRDYPYLAVGWLWYVVTLAPVSGLVQLGGHARSDRYVYVPMVGLVIMLVWGAADVVQRWPRLVPGAVVAASAACLACAALSWGQVRYWENSETLFRHGLDVAPENNYVAHHNLGLYLVDVPGRLQEGIAEFQAAVSMYPGDAQWHSNLGLALSKIPDRLPEALAELQEAERLDPGLAPVHNNLGLVLMEFPGRLPEAVAEFQAALQIDPEYSEAHTNLGEALSKTPERVAEGIAELQRSVQANPDEATAHGDLGVALANMPERLPEAIAELQTALRLKPDTPELHNSLGLTLAKAPGRLPEAIDEFQTAIRLKPDFPEAHSNLGMAFAETPGRLPEAVDEFRASLRIKPDSAVSHNNLGMALAKTPGKLPEAFAEFQAAARLDPNYADAHYNLGLVLSQFPEKQREAVAEMETAERIKHDPLSGQMPDQLQGTRP